MGIQLYTGKVFDGCTAVQVHADFAALGRMPYDELPYASFDLMATGVKTVFDYFDLKWAPVYAVMERLKREKFGFSENLGTRKEKNAALSARLRCIDGAHFEHCVIVADIYRRSEKIHCVPLCTTFPFPDMVARNFVELSWAGPSSLMAKLENQWGASAKKYGRHHFDASGYEGVSGRHYIDPDTNRPLSELLLDINALLQ